MTQDPASTMPAMTRSEERLTVRTQPVAVETVRVRRRIVTEEQMVTVQVRREELVVEHYPHVDARPVDPMVPVSAEPLVIVLHREVPEVLMRTQAYEQVTVTRHTVAGTQQVTADLRREVVGLEQDPPPMR